MDEIELYHYALSQEVLKEVAVEVFNLLLSYMCKHGLSIDDETPYAKLFWEISEFKKNIIDDANNDDAKLDGISAQIKVFRQRVDELIN